MGRYIIRRLLIAIPTLLIISFVDTLAGFTITIRTAQRNIELDNAGHSTS